MVCYALFLKIIIILEFTGISFYLQDMLRIFGEKKCLTELRGHCVFWDDLKMSRRTLCHLKEKTHNQWEGMLSTSRVYTRTVCTSCCTSETSNNIHFQ